MAQPEQADAAKEGLQGEVIEGRTLSIEKARRARPRTPTPGKYFGPPKRGDFRGPPRGGYRDRYEDRRGGGGYRGFRDDYRGGRGYDDYERRGYGGGRRDREDGYASRNIDRYEGGRRDEGYSAAPRERRGGGGGGYYGGREERDDRSYGAPPPRDEQPREYGARDYDREHRYSGR